MKLTVGEFRRMIERSFLHETLGEIEYITDSKKFVDNRGRLVLEGLGSLKGISEWLESRDVSIVTVKGKKMSPSNFIKFLSFMRLK